MDEFQTKIEDFCKYLLIDKKYSNNTISSYHKDLMKYYEFNQNKKLNDITKNDIKDYIAYLKKQELNEKSISRNISSIRSFYKFLLIEKYITNNPMLDIKLPKIKKTLPNTLSIEEIDRLLTNEFIALMQLQKFKISGKDKNIEKIEDIMK